MILFQLSIFAKWPPHDGDCDLTTLSRTSAHGSLQLKHQKLRVGGYTETIPVQAPILDAKLAAWVYRIQAHRQGIWGVTLKVGMRKWEWRMYSVHTAWASSFVCPHVIKFSLPMTFLTWWILPGSPLRFKSKVHQCEFIRLHRWSRPFITWCCTVVDNVCCGY